MISYVWIETVASRFFTNSGRDSGVLHALPGSVAGGNGVIAYGVGLFPRETFGSTYYFADVVFDPA